MWDAFKKEKSLEYVSFMIDFEGIMEWDSTKFKEKMKNINEDQFCLSFFNSYHL